MSTESASDQVNVLLSKLMQDRYCSGEASDFDACIQNFVPQRIDGSHVDQSLQRRGIKKCGPYKDVVQKCMADEKKQQVILKQAWKAPTCKEERSNLAKCQRVRSNCEPEIGETVLCGLVHLVSKKKGQPAPATFAE